MTTVTRALTMPILKPADDAVAWDDLRDMLNLSWRRSTSLANAMMAQLHERHQALRSDDSTIDSKPPRKPKMSEDGLYQLGTSLAPDMPTGTISSLNQMVRKRYKGKVSVLKPGGDRRVQMSADFAAMTGQMSLPSFRYPTPFPCRAQDWRPSVGRGGECIASVTLAPKTRVKVFLKTGGGHKRAAAEYRRIASGELKYREASLVIAGGRPALKVVYDRPVVHRKREGVLSVRTCSESLLVAVLNKDRVWWYHGDDLKRMVAAYTERMQRLADDTKHERRTRRNNLAKRRTAWVEKNRRRTDTILHQITASLVGFADRRNVAVIEYQDQDKSFIESLPWAAIKTMIEWKAADKGVAFREVKETVQS
ncbi:MAG: hypothetical protein AAGI37_19495 [Planctomycetota bacterium]